MHKKDPLGLYIHIPFCIQKCKYCDFYSLSHCEKQFENYTQRLCEGVDFYSQKYARSYNSLYFGGGTPLLLGDAQLGRILERAKPLLTPDAEITAEGNPGTAEKVNFASLRESGFNRLSLGLQSSNNRELQALGRIHTPEEAEKTVAEAQKAGFDNISLDLMIGIPHQTEESLLQSINFCANAGVQHISAYMLKIEQGTALANDPELCALCADEEKAADFYLAAVKELERLGYKQYEISNFAKPGYESRHNLKYWNCEEYLGLGPAAHSFIGDRRFYFERNIGEFIEKPFEEAEQEESSGGGWEEYAMLRLRLCPGLDTAELKSKYPKAPADEILQKAKLFANTGLLNVAGSRITFTPKGFLVANALTAEILY